MTPSAIKVYLYEYRGPGLLEPQYGVFHERLLPDGPEEMRSEHKRESGAEVTMEQIAETDWEGNEPLYDWVQQQIGSRKEP